MLILSKAIKAEKSPKKKHINHNPQSESARAQFGEPKAKEYNPTDFKI